ncbi:MAG: Hpt domain-containing protein [Lachnospiraceae bacterium]|nr:Hpt domain-containing protein [Lachnospiraceae bacterium]
MNIREMYSAIGADYNEVAGRLMDNEAFIIRLVKKYEQDTNCEKLETALKDEDYGDAFDAVHSLKGLSANLGFTRLYKASYELTEALRAEKYDGVNELGREVINAHKEVMDNIKKLD